MNNHTRQAFDQYCQKVARLSGVPSAAQSFSVAPNVQQTLEQVTQDSSDLLRQINIIGVDERVGQRVGVGVSGPIAARTDTETKDRSPRNVAELEGYDYECEPVEFDTHISWQKLDAWSRKKEFQRLIRDSLTRRQGLDRIMIGLNGTNAAKETDRITNPQLQDVAIGWLQQYRDKAPERVLSEGATPGVVRVGPGGDYANLDALIFDAIGEMVDSWHQEDFEMLAMTSTGLMANKYFQMLSLSGDTPTEMMELGSDIQASNVRFGSVSAARLPSMPTGTILITPPGNLSIYWQRGSRRRFVIDNPKRSRIENYESSNEAYVVEDFGAGCLVENIELGSWQ